MHDFYIRKCSSFHHFLQKGLSPNIHHLHLFIVFICLILEFVMEEAFLLIFSIVGLLPCRVNSILEGFYFYFQKLS